jgi:hypothetical protein
MNSLPAFSAMTALPAFLNDSRSLSTKPALDAHYHPPELGYNPFLRKRERLALFPLFPSV